MVTAVPEDENRSQCSDESCVGCLQCSDTVVWLGTQPHQPLQPTSHERVVPVQEVQQGRIAEQAVRTLCTNPQQSPLHTAAFVSQGPNTQEQQQMCQQRGSCWQSSKANRPQTGAGGSSSHKRRDSETALPQSSAATETPKGHRQTKKLSRG